MSASTKFFSKRDLLTDTGVLERAHRIGLAVHTWTFCDDASGYGYKDPKAEKKAYRPLGLDGFFTDFPASGVAARAELN